MLFGDDLDWIVMLFIVLALLAIGAFIVEKIEELSR